MLIQMLLKKLLFYKKSHIISALAYSEGNFHSQWWWLSAAFQCLSALPRGDSKGGNKVLLFPLVAASPN